MADDSHKLPNANKLKAGSCDQLVKELILVIDRWGKESDITCGEVLGALALVQQTYIEASSNAN